MKYTIRITDEDGREVLSKNVRFNVDKKGLRFDEYKGQTDGRVLTEADQVLLYAAPQVCPWDCDTCRSE